MTVFFRRRAPLVLSFMVCLFAVRPAVVRAQSTGTESVELVTGCTNVVLTWPGGTPIATVAAAISPAAALTAIWRLDPATQLYQGYSPQVGASNDLTSVAALDAVYICTTEVAALARPLSTPVTATSPSINATAPAVPYVPPVPTVRFIAAPHTIARGGSTVIAVQTQPFDVCDIDYVPPRGGLALTTGLGPGVADGNGVIRWPLTVNFVTPAGQATITVSCRSGGVSTPVTIV
ncbi:MAG: hypothetical protein U0531_18745 [Dehalococcoidia bacterium]